MSGCVNDASLIGEMLRMANCDRILQVHSEAATRAGILSWLEDALASLREGDVLMLRNASRGYHMTHHGGHELYAHRGEARRGAPMRASASSHEPRTCCNGVSTS